MTNSIKARLDEQRTAQQAVRQYVLFKLISVCTFCMLVLVILSIPNFAERDARVCYPTASQELREDLASAVVDAAKTFEVQTSHIWGALVASGVTKPTSQDVFAAARQLRNARLSGAGVPAMVEREAKRFE